MEIRKLTITLKSGLQTEHLVTWPSKEEYDRFRNFLARAFQKSDRSGSFQAPRPLALYRLIEIAGVRFERVPEEADSRPEFFNLADLSESATVLFDEPNAMSPAEGDWN